MDDIKKAKAAAIVETAVANLNKMFPEQSVDKWYDFIYQDARQMFYNRSTPTEIAHIFLNIAEYALSRSLPRGVQHG